MMMWVLTKPLEDTCNLLKEFEEKNDIQISGKLCRS